MVLPRRPTGFDARALRRAVLPILLACADDAFAAHPLLTEDTGTQGARKFELELGNMWTRDGGERAYELGPQLSYGVLPNLANLGYTCARGDAVNRRDLFHASTAAVMTIDSGWQLLLYDIAVATNPERARSATPAVVRIGAIYTVGPGCDVDVGYQVRLNDAASPWALLAGLTVRW